MTHPFRGTMPFIQPTGDIPWSLLAFYITAATIARSQPTRDATILASRLRLLEEAYREHMLPTARPVRLAAPTP